MIFRTRHSLEESKFRPTVRLSLTALGGGRARKDSIDIASTLPNPSLVELGQQSFLVKLRRLRDSTSARPEYLWYEAEKHARVLDRRAATSPYSTPGI